MKRVLILTASFGDVYHEAARNVCEALESLCDGVRVEVVDLFEAGQGTLNLARSAYSGLARLAPALWGGILSLLDVPEKPGGSYFKLGRLHQDLGDLLQETQPDVVVSTYPAYAALIADLYRDHAERPFRLVTVITDSVTLDPMWLQAPSDVYCAADEAIAALVRDHSIAPNRVKAFGFPVSPRFSQARAALPHPGAHDPYRILYLAERGKKKAVKTLKKLLECRQNHLTIVVGRDPHLKASLTAKLKSYGNRAQVLGWTNEKARLMLTHHLVIAKPDTVTVREAIAACCPMIANQLAPDQDERNTRLLLDSDIGAVASKPRQVVEWVRQAFRRDARLWGQWRENLNHLSRPDASVRIAGVVLDECDLGSGDGEPGPTVAISAFQPAPPAAARQVHTPRQLLCDFHIHTNYSDGKLSVAEVVDFYGRRRFDCICITDHLADSRRLIGKLGKLSRLTLNPAQLCEYFEVIERERRRASRTYKMLVMAGLEFNKDGLTKKSSAHLLGVDLNMPIVDWLDLPETIAQIHAQGGLAIASHPHIMKSEWGKNTLYLWQNQERFIPLIDAWEVANRNNMFNPVSAKRLPYLANSDFHKPKHIYSWKTLVSCEKDPAAIKACIRKNEHIAITLYRDNGSAVRLLASEAPDVEAAAVTGPEARRPAPLIPAA